MNSDVQLIVNLYEAFGHNDFDAIRARLAPDLTVTQPSALPWAGRYRGPDGFFDFFGTLFRYVETELRVEDVYAAGGEIVMVGRSVGVVRANNAPFDVREVHVVSLRNGKVTNLSVLVDTTELLTALHGDVADAR